MSRRFSLLLLLFILILAAGLRFYRIDAQSFWNDEGNSARLAERSLDLIVEGAAGDIHPPGYYLILHYWRGLFGQSEAALRGLSTVCSVLVVLASYGLGRRLFSPAVGLLAALLVAINPFQVYYAQEARMYAMLALWAAASTWATLDWLSDPSPGEPPGLKLHPGLWLYAPSAAAGLYTHYAFPFVLLTQNLGVGLWLWASSRRGDVARRSLTWLGCQVLVVLLYLPWLPTAWRQVTTWPSEGQSYDLLKALGEVWALLTLGPTIPVEAAVGGLAALAFLALLSLFPPIETDEGEAPEEGDLAYGLRWGLVALLVLVPVGLILGLGLYKPAYQKFLLVAAAPLSLLVARGAIGGWRLASGAETWGEPGPSKIAYRGVLALMIGFVLLDSARSLHNLYFDPAYARADYRGIARQLQAQGRLGDAVILNAPNQWEVFTYYYPDGENVFPLPRQRPLDPAQTEAELGQIVADYRRIFAIYWGEGQSDPQGFIEGWLEQHTYKAGETWVGDLRLATYAAPLAPANEPAVPLEVRFAQADGAPLIALDGYSLLTSSLAPGDILQVALFWRALEPMSERYKIFVHLYDDAGRLVAQTDSEPGAGLRPTSTWPSGERVIDRYGVLVPAETLTGDYNLVIGLYPLADPEDRLTVTQADQPADDHLDLGTVQVEP
jgi:4-amino-4-deoxy-L-arabinose transferase-like glycosyltransferase